MASKDKKSSERYRIVLRLTNISEKIGAEAAECMTEGFRMRPWHENVVCAYDDKNRSLILTAENDYDHDGSALIREAAAEYSACIPAGHMEDGDIILERIEKI